MIATAPISPRLHLAAKIESVLIAIFVVFSPFLLGLLGLSWQVALVVAAGIGVSALSATMIQIWFRAQASRRHFRRRQTSSRIATFAEALSSVSWAGATALAASGSWLALAPAIVAALVLLGARRIRPHAQS